MIESILFDLSEVLLQGMKGLDKRISFDTGFTEEEVRSHFRGSKREDLFVGKLSEEEYWSLVIKEGQYELPLEYFRKVIRENFVPLNGTQEILFELKQQGYPLGLLSDHAREWISYIEGKYRFMQAFDGRCYSFECGYTKRSKESFVYAIKELGFIPERTMFIDDHHWNLEVAHSVGIAYTHLFNGAEKLAKAMLDFGLQVRKL